MVLYGSTLTTNKQPSTTIEDLIKQTQAAETKARESQLKQADLARQYLQQIVDIYGPEGAYGKGMETVLGAQKRADVGKAAQRGISSGLYGIRDYGAEWESTVGAKARATLEDIRLERRAQALSGLAGFEAGIEYEPPDYSALMQAVAAGQQIPSGPITTSKWGETFGKAQEWGISPLSGVPTANREPAGESVEEWRARLAEQQEELSKIEIGRPTEYYGPMFEASKEMAGQTGKAPSGADQYTNYTGELKIGGATYYVSKGKVKKVQSRGKWYPVGYPAPVKEYMPGGRYAPTGS